MRASRRLKNQFIYHLFYVPLKSAVLITCLEISCQFSKCQNVLTEGWWRKPGYTNPRSDVGFLRGERESERAWSSLCWPFQRQSIYTDDCVEAGHLLVITRYSLLSQIMSEMWKHSLRYWLKCLISVFYEVEWLKDKKIKEK